MLTRLTLVAVLTLLSACSSAARSAQQAAEYREQIAAIDDATCKSYGLTFGTPAYAHCREERERNRLAFLLQQAAPQQQQSTMTNCYGSSYSLNCTTR
jgi:hypothetical protein